MQERVVNGFTIIAQEWMRDSYIILGARRVGPGHFEYVTARMLNVDTDTEWFWGNYVDGSLARATESFYKRQGE